VAWDVVQEQIPAASFVHKYENVFAFKYVCSVVLIATTFIKIYSCSQSFLASLDKKAEDCHYADYTQKYLRYPPTGPLPLPGKSTEFDDGCDVWTDIFDAALIVSANYCFHIVRRSRHVLQVNPAFDIYRIFDTVTSNVAWTEKAIDLFNHPQYPVLWDVLGMPSQFSQVQESPIYFDRQDVKKAIHAPVNVSWTECSKDPVFPNKDASLPSSLTVLPNVIEKSKRSVIVHGLADFILIAEGMRIALQK
jgi:carboxypeptidase D